MDHAEAMIARIAPEAGIGVGLHPGYNVAQGMYMRRGYVPDGRGAMWRGEFITEGQSVIADDDLVQEPCSKRLRRTAVGTAAQSQDRSRRVRYVTQTD